ncbi:hypothetical protein INR49_003882 [Caranx melampygus]|nr:hypothetical protein INR49_003882 [Caranx melampygus]
MAAGSGFLSLHRRPPPRREHGLDDPPCNCSNRVSIEYLSEGRYRLGDKTIFIRMLHGKHVMVRVGGGWDTLRGFLMKYDPLRVLQFTTLEQKILAFQKGPSACTPTLPRKGAAAAPKKNLQMTPSSPRKPTQLPLPVTTKGSSSLPSTPVGSSSKQSPSPGAQGAQVHRRALTPSAAPSAAPSDPNPTSKLKLKPSPRGAASQPRSPVCPEPSSKCAKPSSPCTSPTTTVPRPVTAPVRGPSPKDGRPPTGASQRSRLAQRRPGSPASRLRLEAARRARTAPRAAATSTLQSRTPTPTSRTACPVLPKPACSLLKGKEATAKAKGAAPSKAAAPPRGTAAAPGRVPGTTEQKQAATTNPSNGKSTVKPEPGPGPALAPQKSSLNIKPVKPQSTISKKPPQSKSKSEDAYFEMNSRRRQKT